MKILISNRALPLEYGGGEIPNRIHIVPRGELFNKEAGITQVLDDKALDSILADLKSRHATKGGLYMGEEHFIYNSDKSSQAFAWGKQFGKDDRGIWVTDYDVTDVGAPAIKNKRYKWTSFVADQAQPGAVENLGNKRVRILKIDTVGFTNYANGKSLLTPITNRMGDMSYCPDDGAKLDAQKSCPTCKKNFADASAPADNNNKPVKNKMKNLMLAMGLSADANEESALAHYAKIKNRITTLEPLEAENTTLRNRVTTMEGDIVDAILAEHKITDAKMVSRVKPALLPLKNRDDRIAYLTDLNLIGGDVDREEQPAPRILNRGGNKGAGKGAGAGEAATQEALDSEVRKIMNRDQLKFEPAFNKLRREKPELFGEAK